MVLVIESSNPEVIHALSELAKALNITYRIEPDNATVSENERIQRWNALLPFKGGLEKYLTGYHADKHDWYLQ